MLYKLLMVVSTTLHLGAGRNQQSLQIIYVSNDVAKATSTLNIEQRAPLENLGFGPFLRLINVKVNPALMGALFDSWHVESVFHLQWDRM